MLSGFWPWIEAVLGPVGLSCLLQAATTTAMRPTSARMHPNRFRRECREDTMIPPSSWLGWVKVPGANTAVAGGGIFANPLDPVNQDLPRHTGLR
jgi:hypothetical protein